jgi:hypothetical protein
MFKFISIVLALIPVFLLLRAVVGRSAVLSRAVADFRRQVDYLVWVMLLVIAVGLVYSVVNLMHPLWR